MILRPATALVLLSIPLHPQAVLFHLVIHHLKLKDQMAKKTSKMESATRRRQAPVKALPVTLLSGFLVWRAESRRQA